MRQQTATDVFLYYPNLIGYMRVLCTISSLLLMMIDGPKYWLLALALYLANFIGDLFDGIVARKFNQTSIFGGLLDMITDRCSTLGLLFVLGVDYSKQDINGIPLFQSSFLFLVILDISSHWCQMYSTSFLGQHHKSEEGNVGRSFLVRWFYKYYYFFGYLCVGAELTYVILYALQFTEGFWFHSTLQSMLLIALPACAMKQLVNIAQLQSACVALAQSDAAKKNQ